MCRIQPQIKVAGFGNFGRGRIAKLLTNEQQYATSLRCSGWYGFWQRLGISTTGTRQRILRLQKLWLILHKPLPIAVAPELPLPAHLQRLVAVVRLNKLLEHAPDAGNHGLSLEIHGTLAHTLVIKFKQQPLLSFNLTQFEFKLVQQLASDGWIASTGALDPELNPELVAAGYYEQATIALQQHLRGYLSRRPEPGSCYWAIRDASGTVLGWKINGHYVAKPEQLCTPSRYGSYKVLTHANANHVGLSLRSARRLKFKPIQPQILSFILRSGLECFIPQYQVNRTFLISSNLGAYDLEALREFNDKRIVNLNLNQILPLVQELEVLHRHGIVHRDIKPGNMLFSGWKIVVTDLDAMGYLGSFRGNKAGTLIIAPVTLIADPDRYGIKLDHYCLLSSLFYLQLGLYLYDSHNHIRQQRLRQFVNSDWIQARYMQSVYNFLFNPLAYELPPLIEVLNFDIQPSNNE